MRPSWHQNAVQEAFENTFAKKCKKSKKCNTYHTFGGSELPTWIKNPLKIDEKSIKKSFKIGIQFLMHLGGILEASMASKTLPKSLPNRRKIDEKSMQKLDRETFHFWDRFFIDFSWILEGFWEAFGGHLGVQNASKMHQKLYSNFE